MSESLTPAPLKPDIMSFFPLQSARKTQELAIREIAKVHGSGIKIVILEAPVGSGKSAIAATLARYVGGSGAHVITPRKSLQDQYFEDFEEHLVLMKGRNAYPCTIDSTPGQYKRVITSIKAGQITQPKRGDETCANAPCIGNGDIFKDCTSERPCPYTVATILAQEHPMVVHNLHSFIFQTSYGKKFEKRDMLIIDEAHEIESTVRDFVTKNVFIPIVIKASEIDGLKTWSEWETFLLEDRFIPKESSQEAARKVQDKTFQSDKDKYLFQIKSLNLSGQLDKGFSVELEPVINVMTNVARGTTFKFIPHNVGGAVQNMLIAYGEKILLMSGTIYNKDVFCKNIGIDPSQAHFIRVGSSFPKENRPIYALEKYQVNTSHASWNDNFAEMIGKIHAVCKVFHDVKGLIHVPSYMAGEQIKNALNDCRFTTHQPGDFQEKLLAHYESKTSDVFVSPVCQQGVDFKGDRARFQIVLRVPYLNTSSKFVEDKVTNDFPWYNYQSLIVFGQQIGRVNRSADDYGVTFLMDERFNKYISRNSKVLPGWVKEAIVWRS